MPPRTASRAIAVEDRDAVDRVHCHGEAGEARAGDREQPGADEDRADAPRPTPRSAGAPAGASNHGSRTCSTGHSHRATQ